MFFFMLSHYDEKLPILSVSLCAASGDAVLHQQFYK